MRYVLLATFIFAGAVITNAQTSDCPVMPAGKLCVSRAVGEAALVADDKIKALEAELKARDEAAAIQRKALDDMRLEYVKASTEVTTLKQNAVSDRAIIELLLKNTKRKCLPFSICIGG